MALYMNGQEISQSSGVPIAVGGLTEIDSTTPTSLNGILKGNGSTVQTAIAGTDYATVEQAKPFVVEFTPNSNHTVTADKTIQEILDAYETGRMVLGIALNRQRGLHIPLQLSFIYTGGLHNQVTFTAFNIDSLVGAWVIFGQQGNEGDEFYFINDINLAVEPASATALPDSGTALTANTIYAVADAVGTYAFTPPDTGWAHGTFTTGSSVSVSFSGTFVGAAPTIEASKAYEFDVFDGVWAVQEVVSA